MTEEGRMGQYRGGLAPTPWPRWPPVNVRDTRIDRKSNDSNGKFRDGHERRAKRPNPAPNSPWVIS